MAVLVMLVTAIHDGGCAAIRDGHEYRMQSGWVYHDEPAERHALCWRDQ